MSTEYAAVQKHCGGISRILENIESRGYAKVDMDKVNQCKSFLMDIAADAIDQDRAGKAKRDEEKKAVRAKAAAVAKEKAGKADSAAKAAEKAKK